MVATYVSGAVVTTGGNYTPGSGSNTCMGLLGGGYNSGGDTCSGQTYNSISMAERQDITLDTAGTRDPCYQLSDLVNPGTSSQAISTTWAAGLTLEEYFGVTLDGVDQTTPVYPTNGSVSATFAADTAPSLTYDAPDGSTILYFKFLRTATPDFTDPSRFGTHVYTKAFQVNTEVRIWQKDQASAVTSATVSSTSTAAQGGVHGVIVYQAAAAGGATFRSLSLLGAGI